MTLESAKILQAGLRKLEDCLLTASAVLASPLHGLWSLGPAAKRTATAPQRDTYLILLVPNVGIKFKQY